MPTLIDRHLKIPKYLQLAEHLREQIDGGQLQPDDRLPSFTEMKSQFDTTQRTIEKAHALLENDGLIRREPGRGVFVNHPAKRQMTGNVGFLAPHNMYPRQGSSYFGMILLGMRQVAKERDYHLLLIDNSDTFNRWDKIDGAVLCHMHRYDPHPDLPQYPRDFPYVGLLNEVPGTPCVVFDDFEGTYQLTKYLIRLGHQRIAYLSQSSPATLLNYRKEGYIKALEEAGIGPESRYTRKQCGSNEQNKMFATHAESAEFTMRRWLQEDWAELGCTALITQNDGAATGAIRALEAAGLRVPRDISVVGFDGVLPETGAPLPLTTIEVPLLEMGRQVMTLLLDWLQTPAQPPQSVCLPVRFIEGDTTAPPPGVVQEHALATA